MTLEIYSIFPDRGTLYSPDTCRSGASDIHSWFLCPDDLHNDSTLISPENVIYYFDRIKLPSLEKLRRAKQDFEIEKSIVLSFFKLKNLLFNQVPFILKRKQLHHDRWFDGMSWHALFDFRNFFIQLLSLIF
jgi:hypothetical protein